MWLRSRLIRPYAVALGLLLMTACFGDTPIPSAPRGFQGRSDPHTPVVPPSRLAAARATAARHTEARISGRGPGRAPIGQAPQSDTSQTLTLDFEGLQEGTFIDSTYASLGVTFIGAMVFNVYNSGAYPPHSGTGVISADLNSDSGTVQVFLERPAANITIYATTMYPLTLTCYTASGALVGTADVPDWPNVYGYEGGPPNEPMVVSGGGITSCLVQGTADWFALDDFTFQFAQGPSVSITKAQTAYGDTSFVTIPGENTVQLAAALSNSADTNTVHWSVADDTTDDVASGTLRAPANGLATALTIVAPPAPAVRFSSGPSRWYALVHDPEPGPMNKKALSFVVRAYVLRAPGDTSWSAPVTIRQKPIDVLRQEYVDWGFNVPERADVMHPADSRFYSADALTVKSDYGAEHLGWLRPELLDGLDTMRVLYGVEKAMEITSGWRNPVHNWVHVRLQQGHLSAWFSVHQFAGAADLDSRGSSEVFYAMSRAGQDAGACMEPPKEWIDANGISTNGLVVMNYDHVHVQWDPSNPCPPTMAKWSSSLLAAN